MVDDWTFPPTEEAVEDDFVFTAHVTPPGFAFTGHRHRLTYGLHLTAREVQVDAVTMARRTLTMTRQQYRLYSLTVSQGGWGLVWHYRDYVLMSQPWTPEGVLARLIRLLRRYGWANEAALRDEIQRWGGKEAGKWFPQLAYHSLIFTEWQPGAWTLTPWIRLGLSFTPIYDALPGQTFYERAAAQFWMQQRRVPSAEEEWHPGVRQVVQHLLTTSPLPDCFEAHPYGEFQQVTSMGVQRLRLNVDRMPEGLHFTRLRDQGDETYSVDGRAFLVEGPHGIQVVTNWAGQRWREALLHPDDEPGLIWHQVGLRLKRACQAARLVPVRI